MDMTCPVAVDHVSWRDSLVVLAIRKPRTDIARKYGIFAGNADEYQEPTARAFDLLLFK
jgi:hypothetical protein